MQIPEAASAPVAQNKLKKKILKKALHLYTSLNYLYISVLKNEWKCSYKHVRRNLGEKKGFPNIIFKRFSETFVKEKEELTTS